MTHASLALMPFDGRDVPHVVIEVNQKCNISCTACYKDKYNYTKPLAQVKKEIDHAVAERNLSTITFAGGEPTLSPDLPEIIRYVLSKRVAPQMLSNGLALSDEKLIEYKKAGLKEVFLHIDSLQRRADVRGSKTEGELNTLRSSISERVVRHGLICSVVVTLYKKTLSELPEIVEFVLKNPNITRLLVTCYTDFDSISKGFTQGEVLGRVYSLKPSADAKASEPNPVLENQSLTTREVKELLNSKFGMYPFGYVGSNLNHSDERWIIYNSFTIMESDGRCHFLHIGPKFKKVADFMHRMKKKSGKPYSFGSVMDKADCVKACLLYAAFSFDPKIILETGKFLAHLRKPNSKIFYKSLTFQQGPNLTATGEIEYCKDCPDATVRNGHLIPVCLADVLDALPASELA